LGLTQVTGYVNALDAGWQNKSQTGQPTEHGVEVQLELPIFDLGAVNRRRAQLEYRQAVDAAAAQAVNAQSQVREAYAAYRSAHEVARRLIDEVVPTRKRIAEENQLRYNGMLIDVFELLADARNQIDSVTASVQAQRDFWQAETRLQASLAGSPPVERAPSNR
jgi:outer membrane protein TolC